MGKKQKKKTDKKVIWVSLALIMVLGIIVYWNSLAGQFIWDDELLIRDNLYVKNWQYVDDIVFKQNVLTRHIGEGETSGYSFYRPLQMISHMIDYSLWGLDVRGHHFTSILLHILAALSIYWLISLLFNDKLLSSLVALFFVSHPINSEAVAYISGRSDSLSLVFIALSFIFYIKYLKLQNIGKYVLLLVSFICAVLSRENAVIFPFLLLLYHFTFGEKLKIKTISPLFVISSAKEGSHLNF